ncbi:MAG: DUF3501 family protein [Gammaproteobacteria bacterium]|nr:DUF3501 family protein [Gammaproteobacteria bacterium]
MAHLTRDDLYSLEQYATERQAMRERVMRHKQARRVDLGDAVSLYFEDKLTMQYQIQEMLRVERIFEPDAIQEELDAYNPLIPDGQNWKATMMIQIEDVEARRKALARMQGIEDAIWIRVGDHDPVTPIADEDLERDSEEKTSSVHFLRFELTPEMASAAKAGEPIQLGVDHPEYKAETGPLPDATRASLVEDLD